jgi:cytoskeletal protein RodZ
MEENDPSLRPVSNHPNAVRSVNEHSDEDPEPVTPREYLPPQYQKDSSKKGRYILITVVVILLLAAAVYWFLLKPKPAKAPTTSNATTASSSAKSKSKESEIETEHHESPSFNLGFDYPKGWKVSDISGSDKIIVSSTPMKLKDANGQEVEGQIIMTVRGKTQKLPEFDKGAATATADSEKINYTKPSETQRGSTYISFLNYASSNENGLDSIYITGDAGYQKDQAVPAVDISRIDPITNVTFVKCPDSKCAGTTAALTVDSNSWKDSTFSAPIKTLLQSLSIQ